MAYATWIEVQVFLPPDSASSTAVESKAHDLLEPEYRSINAKLSERYVTPFVEATSPEAYAWAQDLNAKFVAAKAMLAARAIAGDEEAVTWYPDRLLKEAEAALAAAAAGTITLSDATLSTTEGTEFRATDGYSDLTTTEQTAVGPWFKRSDTW